MTLGQINSIHNESVQPCTKKRKYLLGHFRVRVPPFWFCNKKQLFSFFSSSSQSTLVESVVRISMGDGPESPAMDLGKSFQDFVKLLPVRSEECRSQCSLCWEWKRNTLDIKGSWSLTRKVLYFMRILRVKRSQINWSKVSIKRNKQLL